MTKSGKLFVLLIMEQCNPEWASVPLVGYNFYHGVRDLARVTLVTHERNREALEKVRDGHEIEYIAESGLIRKYYGLVSRLTSRGGVNWPLQHALSYPIYAGFNRAVYRRYRRQVTSGTFDLVHALTPMLPRYPVKMIDACGSTPFLLGPVNGGVPFPDGFREVARKEFAHFNVLRLFTRLIPGYARTYRRAHRVLAGSTYTRGMLAETFGLAKDRLELFHENGIMKSFIGQARADFPERLELLFVGRLVPYKGADMAIDAMARLDGEKQDKVHLTIVGDGSERQNLEQQVDALGLRDRVTFTGWVDQAVTLDYYRSSHVFCFPSVREFGGAVALEAMACGLPCIVPDHAGLGEYVTEETGFKIAPTSREHLVTELARCIEGLQGNPDLLERMSSRAIERVTEYEWGRKAERLYGVYEELARSSGGQAS